jgi:aspartyl-tRNA(Asn)/glutamyl-tRNA(Gln) amidotransferase subunit B
MPGALPVINGLAVNYTLQTALALGCTVDELSKFDRKNYSYADLPKGYQISQFDMPIGRDGMLMFETEDGERSCGIIRVHLEEDTGKTIHTSVDGRGVSLVDLNRSGVPLMEIVSKPDLRSPSDARAYFEALRQTLMYLNVCDGNLQEGSMRADVNVSVHRQGESLGTKVEVKNLNSFRAVQRALEYEIERQTSLLETGQSVVQETRGWSDDRQVTLGQRTKEYAHDYRYFPEPDLPYLRFTPGQIEDVRAAMPEMPLARASRFSTDYGLSVATSRVLTADRSIADFFEQVVAAAPFVTPAEVAKWVTGEVLRLMKDTGGEAGGIPVGAANLASLLDMVRGGQVSNTAAKTVLEEMVISGDSAVDVVARLGLERVGDAASIDWLVRDVLAANPSKVGQYLEGKLQVAQSLFGDVMKASKGKADPRLVRDLLEQRLRDAGG